MKTATSAKPGRWGRFAALLAVMIAAVLILAGPSVRGRNPQASPPARGHSPTEEGAAGAVEDGARYLMLYEHLDPGDKNLYIIFNVWESRAGVLEFKAGFKLYKSEKGYGVSSDPEAEGPVNVLKKEILLVDHYISDRVSDLQKSIGAKDDGSWGDETWLDLAEFLKKNFNKDIQLAGHQYWVIYVNQLKLAPAFLRTCRTSIGINTDSPVKK